MGKSILYAALITAAFACFAACAPPAPSAAVSAREGEVVSGDAVSASASGAFASGESVQAAASSAAQPVRASGSIFDGFLATVPESGVVNVTDKSGTAFQVDASDANVGKLWKLLLSQSYDKLEASDALYQGAYDSISLSFSQDEDKYLIKLYGCGDGHPAYPGKTVIDLESHGGGDSSFETYACGFSIFEEASALVERLRGTLRVILNAPFVQLEAGELDGRTLTAWLQMGDRFLCAFSGGDGNSVMTFDAKTGRLLGTSRISDKVTRMEPAREESGFDYQVFTETRIVYKNSRNPLTEKPYTLPADVHVSQPDGGFDVKGGKLAWNDGDSVYISNPDGTEKRTILEAGELSGLAGALAPSEPMKPAAPRLMNEGRQAVVPVVAGEKLVGAVLADLEGDTKTGYFDVFGKEWQFLAFPDKRTFAAAGENDVTVVDVTSGESKRLPFAHKDGTEWFSGDYSTFLVNEAEKDTLFTGYLASARKAQDRSRPFLTVEGRGTFRAVGASERNLLAYVDDDEGPRYILVNYKN